MCIREPRIPSGWQNSSAKAARNSGAPRVWLLISLFTSLLAIPLACQCCLHATLFTGLQIVGVTLDFLDNVFLLNLPLKPA